MLPMQEAQCLHWVQLFKKGAEVDVEKYKQFTQTKTITQKEMVEVPYHNTLCSTCQHVCHQHCGLQEIATPGAVFLSCGSYS